MTIEIIICSILRVPNDDVWHNDVSLKLWRRNRDCRNEEATIFDFMKKFYSYLCSCQRQVHVLTTGGKVCIFINIYLSFIISKVFYYLSLKWKKKKKWNKKQIFFAAMLHSGNVTHSISIVCLFFPGINSPIHWSLKLLYRKTK